MAHINLLPWREELRAKRQREFLFTLVGAAVIACLVASLAHLRMQAFLDAQEVRNEFLTTEIARLEERIKKIRNLEDTKSKLLARMNIIQELQRNRPLSVHLADEMVRTLPDGVYLTEFSQKNQSLVMSGAAQSNARVSAYMRNIDASDWLYEPALDVIKTNDETGQRIAEFTLRAMQKGTMNEDQQDFAAGDTDGTSGT